MDRLGARHAKFDEIRAFFHFLSLYFNPKILSYFPGWGLASAKSKFHWTYYQIKKIRCLFANTGLVSSNIFSRQIQKTVIAQCVKLCMGIRWMGRPAPVKTCKRCSRQQASRMTTGSTLWGQVTSTHSAPPVTQRDSNESKSWPEPLSTKSIKFGLATYSFLCLLLVDYHWLV